MTYKEYLKQLYNKKSAAWRKKQREDKQPCQICGDYIVEVTIEGFWLCRYHRIELQNMQPIRSYEEKLHLLGISPPSEEEFNKGIKPKQYTPPKIKHDIYQWKFSIGKMKGSTKK